MRLFISVSKTNLLSCYRKINKVGNYTSISIIYSSPTGFETIMREDCHSYLSASTGFLVAAFQLCQLTVNKAIAKANIPEKAKIHQLNSVL